MRLFVCSACLEFKTASTRAQTLSGLKISRLPGYLSSDEIRVVSTRCAAGPDAHSGGEKKY